MATKVYVYNNMHKESRKDILKQQMISQTLCKLGFKIVHYD